MKNRLHRDVGVCYIAMDFFGYAVGHKNAVV